MPSPGAAAARPPITILHGYRYVSPRDTARAILRMQRVCKHGKYLDCVVQWAEVKVITAAFADVLSNDQIRQPDAFLEWYRENHSNLIDKK